MKKIIKNNEGIALVMVILLLALVGSLATTMMLMYSSNIDLVQDATARSQAFYAAEGGVNYLDLKLNEFYQDNIAGIGFFSAEKIYEKLQDLESQFEDDNLRVAGYDISIEFNPAPNYEESNIYIYKITADNGSESETITVEYLIEHLIDYFKYSRFANKVNIEDSYIGYEFSWNRRPRYYNDNNIDDHAFGTAEVSYSKWSNKSSYFEGELVVHNNKVYISKNDYSSNEAVEPGENNWQNNWRIDNFFKAWDTNKSYKAREKVIYDNEIYTSKINDNLTEPDLDNFNSNYWEINDPDLAKQDFSASKVDYSQMALPSPDDYDYQEKIIEAFKQKLKDKGGYTYKDLEPDTNKYPQYDPNERYSLDDMMIYDNKVYKAVRRDDNYNSAVWKEQSASQLFLDDTDSNFTEGNYVYIKGDFDPSYEEIKYFNKTDEVIHILVEGKISPQANVSLRNNANIIFYTTSDSVSFENGYITMPSNSDINLAYFAPFATYTSNGFFGGYASSMIFNEINLKNEKITSVETYSENNPLRGGIDPDIAKLTRAHGDPDYEIDKTGPSRVYWSVMR
ncbi:hypothetical protein C8C77_12150 [Halanaerobium saccharolyticum]|uniref:Type 4 fimbrial biogenesis protein PilX N-terminal domain-containing protein n=1 Tax=Halanaerobium saccharolyticum TaxID=43595 RepID=A0A4R7Z1F2_9FIRM|nr:pilus assembly PilX N-terminal domain-containing protein [Halanaerobium saccharolyticum]RAK06714.1 hypothetical protein C7958_12050 [Halanaerobium saccharolyticum]TDW01351.1 hypothetical protein C8C77_12150 [Halanaerobium saccharolyticum]TDX52819.1 hypothetical protein C7956_12150 [Halanaerobium saccharolyticum]